MATIADIHNMKGWAQLMRTASQAGVQAQTAINSGLIVPHLSAPLHTQEQLTMANVFPIPESITIQIASAVGAGSAPTQSFVLNQDLLNNIQDNGSGPGSIVYTYQDGFAGNVVNSLFSLARAGVGVVCYGFAVRMNVTATGAGDAAGLAACNPFFVSFNAFGRGINNDTNITQDQTRSDFDTSIGVFRTIQNLARFTQLGLIVPVGDTVTITIYTTPNFKL